MATQRKVVTKVFRIEVDICTSRLTCLTASRFDLWRMAYDPTCDRLE